MLNGASKGIYGDELITATELNRQPGRVLDIALERPVTITRNDESFALLPRDEMTWLVKAATLSKVVFEVINVAYKLRLGEQIDKAHPYQWLHVFDSEELSQLITEVETGFHQAEIEATGWDKLSATLHEWHESAVAISSPELAAAFSDEVDEVLLTQPSNE